MFIHLGSDVMVASAEVIAIFDLDTLADDAGNEQFLDWLKADNRLEVVDPSSTARSFILTSGCCYLSPISPATLAERSALDYELEPVLSAEDAVAGTAGGSNED